ncbi:MAG: L-ascorbate 6-phosphate lactonase [Spirochaetaceae bacterium]|jgi:L-ascorbate 6-phosphate lactonase|nr:L-ascorbate 6-phosphate lactonase [Spirochaetaceae bacterium]
MPNIAEITRESWILGAFPEWGTWLNEEIEEEQVKPGSFAMWWLGCTGLWIKSEGAANIAVDLWFGNGKRSRKTKEMEAFHQMRNMCGGRLTQPNLRAAPIVFDPFAVTGVDAVLSTHYHNDHIDPFFAAAVLKQCPGTVPFIGPQKSVEKWRSYGVPENRCRTVKPGDQLTVKDCTIIVLDSFDRTCLVTAGKDIRGICPDDMDQKAVNYLIKTPAGSLYHSGDSHYSIRYAEHGKKHEIDVALGSFGENPPGVQDKMSSADILRMAEALRCKVVIPFHYDVWTNFKADPEEIMLLYKFKKETLDYRFSPFIWDVGGKYVWPADRNKVKYHYRRGFEDCFTEEPNVPFSSIL